MDRVRSAGENSDRAEKRCGLKLIKPTAGAIRVNGERVDQLVSISPQPTSQPGNHPR